MKEFVHTTSKYIAQLIIQGFLMARSAIMNVLLKQISHIRMYKGRSLTHRVTHRLCILIFIHTILCYMLRVKTS